MIGAAAREGQDRAGRRTAKPSGDVAHQPSVRDQLARDRVGRGGRFDKHPGAFERWPGHAHVFSSATKS
jgi:hypothetical protein